MNKFTTMNKSIILLISFLSLSLNAYCQKFTLAELISMTKMSFDDFDTYATNKKYIYLKAESEEIFKSTSYAFNPTNDKAKFFIAKYEYFIIPKAAVSYQFASSEYYTSIKNELIKAGFKLLSEKEKDGEKNFKYNKDGIVIDIWIMRDNENNAGIQETYYEISSSIKK